MGKSVNGYFREFIAGKIIELNGRIYQPWCFVFKKDEIQVLCVSKVQGLQPLLLLRGHNANVRWKWFSSEQESV